MLLFKDIHGNRIDPVNHTLEVIKNYPYAEIHIGTDSQNINKESRYTTVIAYRLGSRGVHYILSKKTVSIIRDDLSTVSYNNQHIKYLLDLTKNENTTHILTLSPFLLYHLSRALLKPY